MHFEKLKDHVSVCFSYTDQLDNTTCMDKSVSDDYMGESELGVLNDLFHDFVLACGFTYLADKRIKWVDDNR